MNVGLVLLAGACTDAYNIISEDADAVLFYRFERVEACGSPGLVFVHHKYACTSSQDEGK